MTAGALAGQRILVTRPEGQGDALAAAIVRRGGSAWQFPLLTIEPLQERAPLEACKQRILALDEYRTVIFVSGNAVRFGVAWIEDYWPQLPVGIRWLGIGAATCDAMQRAGLPVETRFAAAHPMNSEALLELPALQSPTDEKILIIKGEGGRRHLQETLSARGARVDTAECYRRSGPCGDAGTLLDLIRGQHIGTICINSGDSLSHLCDLLGDQLSEVLSLQLVVPSQRVARQAGERGFGHVVTAANASDAAVLEALSTSVVGQQ